MPVRVRWFDKEFERNTLNPRIIDFLNRVGARGEALSKHIISGGMGAGLRALDKGFLMNSLTWIVDETQLAIRIGTYIARSDGKPLKYAIHVFLGTHKMPARPVLRTMLSMLKSELR